MNNLDKIAREAANKFKADEWNIEKVANDPIPHLAAIIKSAIEKADAEGWERGWTDAIRSAKAFIRKHEQVDDQIQARR